MTEPPDPTPVTPALPPAAAGSSATKKPKVRRRRQGTAHFHLSSRAVDISVAEVLHWDERRCREFVIEARWGALDRIRCPH